jgi:hypothetical protein
MQPLSENDMAFGEEQENKIDIDLPALIERHVSDSSESEDADSCNIVGQHWEDRHSVTFIKERNISGSLYDNFARKRVFHQKEHVVEFDPASIHAIQVNMKDMKEIAKLKRAIVEFPNMSVNCPGKKYTSVRSQSNRKNVGLEALRETGV